MYRQRKIRFAYPYFWYFPPSVRRVLHDGRKSA